MQGLLHKVSRKSDIKYCFVLFSDALMYGSRKPSGGQIKHHRTLDLHNMQVAPCPLPNSFEILAEKSFVVTASDDKQRDKWYKAIQQEISNLGLQEGRVETAAVWKQDRMVSGCLICHNTFNLVRRRHHCRKCGEVVCDPCSKHRMPMNIVVPTSDATTPQRVCDNCIGDLRVRIPTMSSQSNMNGIARSRSARGLAGVDLDLSLPKSQLSSADMTKRQHIAHELFMTEKTYVTMLTNLRELFTDPMLADAEARVPKIGKICRLTSEDKLTSMSVFLSSVRQIQTLNAQVFQELHERINGWTDDRTLGDVFCKLAPLFPMYSTYSDAHEFAALTLVTYATKNKEFADFID